MKRNFFLGLLFFLLCNFISAQQKKYYDLDWQETSAEKAAFYRTTEKLGSFFIIKDFFISGAKQFEGKSAVAEEPISLEGEAIWYEEDGSVIQKGTFIGNLPHGEISFYYSDGTLKTSGQYKEGKLNGLYTEYFPSGDISAQGNFVMDLLNGSSVKYKSAGRPDYKVNYKNGAVDGPYEFYNSGNHLFSKGNAKNNSQDGFCQEFFYEGELYAEYWVKNKKLDGLYLEFNRKKDTTTIAHLKDGVALDFTSKSLATTNGSRFSAEMQLVNGIEYWKVFRDGQLIVNATFRNGKKTGLWKVFRFDGSKLIQTINFGENSTCQEEYIQETKAEFSPNFSLSKRFQFDSDMLEINDCKNAVVTDLSNEFRNDHPFYHTNNDGKSILDLLNKPDVVENYIDPSKKQDFQAKNKCTVFEGDQKVTICEKEIDKIIHKVILSENVQSLKDIKQSTTPKSNEIYFFFQQHESRTYDFSKEKRPDRYIDFVISKPLKEAFRDKTLDYISVIGVYESKFWNISDFSGMAAYEAYEKEMKIK